MGSEQDFNMDDYAFHSGGDPDFYYFGEEVDFANMPQEVPLGPQFTFTEDINSGIMAQEVPLDRPNPTIGFQGGPWATHATLGQGPSPIVTPQEAFTPDYMGMNVNFPTTYIGQDAIPAPMPASMPAPEMFQQRNTLPSPPMTQGAASTATTSSTSSTGPTPPPPTQAATPPAEAPRQRGKPGPRGYKRSGKACTRCRKNKLRCDDIPQGCANCAATGCTCMASTASGEVPRMHAHNTDNLVQVLHRHMVALEAYIQAHGGVAPERPDELKQW
ncbi:Zn(2)-C6 fungal-type domain-containing protein [Trichoderma simmonsii]|uniref:Zn(2)-C6 fungal-type domain-containing protein n=1 Tax=Trichoderma simmonsii TaxID=1491479 RepID=A0A8G0LIZ1_9HYPO|nr:Zn(2)-C6 fungal-type domain-containing protein [Trichoderma simmonsii]